MTLIKVAYFMLNFLNLKSKARHLFFWVASSLSMLCTQYKNVLCDTVVMEPDPIMPQFCAFFNASRVTDVCPHYCTISYTCNV